MITRKDMQTKVQNCLDCVGGSIPYISICFDIHTINMVVSFLLKDSALRTRKAISNIGKLFSLFDPAIYEGNQEIAARIEIVLNLVEALVNERFDENDFLMMYCKDNIQHPYAKEIFDEYIQGLKPIKYAESKYLLRKIDNTLEFGYITIFKDVMLDLLEGVDKNNVTEYSGYAKDLYAIANALNAIRRSVKSNDSTRIISLSEDVFDSTIHEAVVRLSDRNRMFVTGIRFLNALLSPGFVGSRLYMFLAFPGKGKSTMLMLSSLYIRNYNRSIKTTDPNKRPAVLIFNLENDNIETVERIFNMTTSADDIRNYKPNQVVKMMKEKGDLKLTPENNIDIIIHEYNNLELSTTDVYSIIDDYADRGVEVICVVVDYLKRIRPAQKYTNEKEQLNHATNELKAIAKYYRIPVISAHQLNRTGAAVIDAAMLKNTDDATKLIGRESIAGAWEVNENCDWICIVNPSVSNSTGKRYLSFKLLKRRYRSIEENEQLRRLEYFNQPYEEGNDIRLVEDFYQDEPSGTVSLSSEFASLTDNQSRGKKNAINRFTKASSVVSDELSDASDMFDEFDMSEYDY